MARGITKILADNYFVNNFCQENDISFLGLFGSYARGEAGRKSDVDFLVDFSRAKSLFDFASVKIKLEDALGREVDLVMRDNIKPGIKRNIINETIMLYEKEERA